MFVASAFIAVATFSTQTSHAQSKAAVPNVFRPIYDFTGDARTDFSTLDIGADGTPIRWRVLRNPADPAPGAAFIRVFDFGVASDTVANDTAVPNDFIGDGKTDVAVWRAQTGQFFVAPYPDSGAPITSTTTFYIGGPPQVDNVGRDGDYDGDGKKDPTTVRVASSLITWNMQLSGGGSRSVQFGRTVTGRSTFVFQGADFTGDGRDELIFATVNTTTGVGVNTWWVGDAVTGAVVLALPSGWGNWQTDYFINPADYTGDGKADIVVMRAGGAIGGDGGAWFIRDTATGNLVPPRVFGIPDPTFTAPDVAVRGDYDGDGICDLAVWRPSTATYYWINSSNGSIGGQQWGTPNSTTEFPIASLFEF
jgi:hypothetical protein